MQKIFVILLSLKLLSECYSQGSKTLVVFHFYSNISVRNSSPSSGKLKIFKTYICQNKEMVVLMSSRGCISRTASVEFQSIVVGEGNSSYIRDFISVESYLVANVTDFEAEIISDCAESTFQAELNSFTFENETCIGYILWRPVPSELSVSSNALGGRVFYFAQTQLTQYDEPDCQPLFEKYSIGCLYFSVSDFDDYEDAFNHCAAVGGALYEPRNLNELAELLQNVTLNFPSSTKYWISLKQVSETWIWPETNLTQPLGPDYWVVDNPNTDHECGFLITGDEGGEGALFSDTCTKSIKVLCTTKD